MIVYAIFGSITQHRQQYNEKGSRYKQELMNKTQEKGIHILY